MIRLAWGLLVLTTASVIGAAVVADLLIHAHSSLILRALKRRRHARGQQFVAAKLRADAVKTFGVAEPGAS